MVRMSNVWDRTTEVLAGRGRVLGGIAAITIFLPGVVRAGYAAYVRTEGMAAAAIGGMLSILVALLTIWGQLALIALSSDPATTQADAAAIARRRLWAAIGVALVIGLVLGVFLIPIFVALAAAGLDPAAMQAGTMPTIPPGTAGFLLLYGIAYLVLFLLFSARMALWTPIVVNERRGIGTIRRSFELTRGLTAKIIGLFLLYLVIVLVALGAAQAVTGVVARLILGADRIATVTFLAAIAGSIVTTALAVVAAVFTAQLYVAVRGSTPHP